MEHLSLEIFDLTGNGSKYAVLEPNASISITDTSEIFSSGDVWSHPFTLDIRANAHIFGTTGETHGGRLYEQIHKRRARLWIEGLPVYLGYLVLGDEVEVDEDGKVDVSFESGQKTFDRLIEGAKANQVPMMSDVLIGMALWRKRWSSYNLQLEAAAVYTDGGTSGWGDVRCDSGNVINFTNEGEINEQVLQQYPRMVYPKGTFFHADDGKAETIDCINTDYPFDDKHPYCNVALCYQKYGYEKTMEDGSVQNDYSGDPEAQRGYEISPASRVNSAPNFYVIYWIKALMNHIGIFIDENQMEDVEDLRRLFFVNTNCAYIEPPFLRAIPTDNRFGKFKFSKADERTDRLIAEFYGPWLRKTLFYDEGYYRGDIIDIKDSAFTSYNFKSSYSWSGGGSGILTPPEIDHIKLRVKRLEPSSQEERNVYEANNNYLHYAFASSDCFPNVDISEVINAVESGFGVRFLFDDNYQRVRIVLLRNIFRSNEVHELICEAQPGVKVENGIRGFRMTYGVSDDTSFYYKGFADLLPHMKTLWPDTSDKHDYSHWQLNADYAKIIKKVSAFDRTCYVTPYNGNAYGIKVDKDAKRYKYLRQSLLEFASFMDAEDGDCTGEEDTIKTIEVGFTPIIMNDVNFEEERNTDSDIPRYALFVDEKMNPRRVNLEDGADYNNPDTIYDVDKLYAETSPAKDMKFGGIVKPGVFTIKSDMHIEAADLSAHRLYYFKGGIALGYWDISEMLIDGYLNEGILLYLQDNYEPNDDGVSPIETHDWGLTLGVMRGSGSDAYVNYESDPDDGEGNDTWDVVQGSEATVHPDTCDCYGRLWDYNGVGGTSVVKTSAEAKIIMGVLWPNTNFELVYRTSDNYLISTLQVSGVMDDKGEKHTLLFAKSTLEGSLYSSAQIRSYAAQTLAGKSVTQMYADDRANWGILIETDSSGERGRTLIALQEKAFAGAAGDIIIDAGGVDVKEGRFSLKLRAEKPNPTFDSTQPDSDKNRRYLEITDENLRGRGLCDQFYKESSYWERNARIKNIPVRMTLAQLLSIDKSIRQKVGDVTGFVRKIQYSVSNQTGLGTVTLEMMYI